VKSFKTGGSDQISYIFAIIDNLISCQFDALVTAVGVVETVSIQNNKYFKKSTFNRFQSSQIIIFNHTFYKEKVIILFLFN